MPYYHWQAEEFDGEWYLQQDGLFYMWDEDPEPGKIAECLNTAVKYAAYLATPDIMPVSYFNAYIKEVYEQADLFLWTFPGFTPVRPRRWQMAFYEARYLLKKIRPPWRLGRSAYP